MSNLFIETKEVLSSAESALEQVADKVLGDSESTPTELNTPIEDKKESDPFSSDFDKDHPMPTYEQLLNAGFTPEMANKILYNTSHVYSQKELFQCLYKSDDPVKAFNEMMSAKAQAHIETMEDYLSKNGV